MHCENTRIHLCLHPSGCGCSGRYRPFNGLIVLRCVQAFLSILGQVAAPPKFVQICRRRVRQRRVSRYRQSFARTSRPNSCRRRINCRGVWRKPCVFCLPLCQWRGRQYELQGCLSLCSRQLKVKKEVRKRVTQCWQTGVGPRIRKAHTTQQTHPRFTLQNPPTHTPTHPPIQ